MGTVTGLIFYVGPNLQRAWRPPQNLMLHANDSGSLCQIFRKGLLGGPEAFSVQLSLVPFPKLNCNFSVCGQTAGVANWWRDNSTEALTAYLPGVDEDDEYLVEQALVSKPYPIPLYRWHEVLKVKRVIYATFLLTPASAEDRLIGTAAAALANSFVPTLGVE